MIILLGSKGQLGTSLAIQLSKNKHEFLAVDNTALDVTNPEMVRHYISILQPQVIINASAYTNVALAEKQPDIAMKVNRDAIQHVWNSAIHSYSNKEKLLVVLHYSTDYVFDGKIDNQNQYKESDKTNPLNQYGISKREGEKSLSQYERHFIFRTSWLFSQHGPNFVRTISNKLMEENEEPVKIVHDQFGSPTSAEALAKMSVKIIDQIVGKNFVQNCNVLSQNNAYGIYHFSGAGKHSWFDFGQTIRSYLKLYTTKRLRNIIPQYNIPNPVTRPHYSVMDCSKIKKLLNLTEDYFNWEKDCDDCIQKLLK